ncbi:MAG: rRNA maturation RNase YbeY [Polyangiaceae bacterium]|nr:rRNA maturation RNase YbeY [Polyangiaceae bacterium]
MIRVLQLNKFDISFVLTTDEQVHQLNKIYRKKDRPTDVLAFAMHEGEFGALAGNVLGDVIVSVPTARRQAEARGVRVLDEVTMLLAHGLLHLLGWDHDTTAKDRRMRAETDRLCAAATGSPPPATNAKAVSKASSKAGAARGLLQKPAAHPKLARRKAP